MGDILTVIQSNLATIVSIGTALAAIYGWVKKPLDQIRKQNREQDKKLTRLDEDTADLLCSQLTREHDYYMRLGFCPSADKLRLNDIYSRYKARGRNHLADTYLDDISRLPNAYEDHNHE